MKNKICIDVYSALKRHNLMASKEIACISALLVSLIEALPSKKDREFCRAACREVLRENPDLEFIKSLESYS